MADFKMFKKRFCLCRLMRSEQGELWKLVMGKHPVIQHQEPTGAARALAPVGGRHDAFGSGLSFILYSWGLSWCGMVRSALVMAGLTQGSTCTEHSEAPAAHLVLSQGLTHRHSFDSIFLHC